MIVAGRVSQAKAIIKQMSEPYFKFYGVLALRQEIKKEEEASYYKRLEKYVKEKLEGGHQSLARMALVGDRVTKSSAKTSYEQALEASGHKGVNSIAEGCSPGFVTTLFDSISKFNENLLISVARGTADFNAYQAYHLVAKSSGTHDTAFLVEDTKNELEACAAEDRPNYWLASVIHGQLLIDSPPVATRFKRLLLTRSIQNEEMFRYFYDHFGRSEKYFYSKANDRKKFRFIDIVGNSTHILFEKEVDWGNVCAASKTLFTKIKKTRYFDNAVGYMINSPNVNYSDKHSCGDEDLELLLN